MENLIEENLDININSSLFSPLSMYLPANQVTTISVMIQPVRVIKQA